MSAAPAILLVEPDEVLREELSALLAANGYVVQAQAAPESAASWVAEGNSPQAVIVTCGPRELGRLSGFVQKLRAIPATAQCEIIVLTSIALTPMDDRTRVLPRPFDVDKLLRVLD